MLEQMYLITVPKISVLEPNSWETLTEFSCDKNRTGLVVRPKVHLFCSRSMSHVGEGSNTFEELLLGTSAQGSSIFCPTGESFCEGSNTAAFHRLRQNAANACRVATRHEQLELVAGLAAAYGDCEDLGGCDGEHEARIGEQSLFVFIVEGKIAVAYLVGPASLPLGRPHRG